MFPTGRTLTMVCGGVAALLLGAVACDDVLGTEAEAAPPQVFEVIQDTLSSMVVATEVSASAKRPVSPLAQRPPSPRWP